MPQTKIVQEKIEERNTLFLATHIEMKNANIVLLSEKESRLGTVAAAIPQRSKMIGPPLSSILLGDRNVAVARLLAEHLAKKNSKITVVSIYLETVDEREAGPILLKLLEKTITKGDAKE